MATWKILLALEAVKKLPEIQALSSGELEKFITEFEDVVEEKETQELAEEQNEDQEEDPATTVARENAEACIDRE